MAQSKRLSDRIPYYPAGCSAEILAIESGILKEPYNDRENAERALRRLRRQLDRETLEEEGLAERYMPVQKSTRDRLREYNFPEIEDEEILYFSVIRKEEREDKEKEDGKS